VNAHAAAAAAPPFANARRLNPRSVLFRFIGISLAENGRAFSFAVRAATTRSGIVPASGSSKMDNR
jgi:hypothetical protein